MNTSNAHQENHLDSIPIRGSVDAFASYLGDSMLSAEEFVRLKPEVPMGLLQALGLQANSVPLPTEDPATFVMNTTKQLLGRLSPDFDPRSIEFVEVGTESIKDGALPISQYVLKFFDHDDIMSNESKHACVAAVNAVWRNLGDTGLVFATDIATYAEDDLTAPSAEFTGGAGAIGVLLRPSSEGRLLDILNVRGVSSGLTYDFYKPYSISGQDIFAQTYPIVFGNYSNLANLERVSRAYLNLKEKVNIKLDDFSGFVFHAPYPGITKYNLAALLLVEQDPFGMKDQFFNLIEQAHEYFRNSEYEQIPGLEKQIKREILKPIIKTVEYGKYYDRLKESLKFIAQTGNLYTGSSPLCMMSLLENQQFRAGEYILWGGYGSGNQAVFMIGRTKETTAIAKSYSTQESLNQRRTISAEYYDQIKPLASTSLDALQYHEFNGMSTYLIPRTGYYAQSINPFQIKTYNDQSNIYPDNYDKGENEYISQEF